MTEKNTIGVVIPAYKRGLRLRWTLDSIAAQQRKPDKVCVVFDGEDTVGESLARRYPAVTDVTVLKEASGGAARPRNEGWNLIRRGVDYIHFLDDDDLIAPWFYERLSQALNDDITLSGVRAPGFDMSQEEIEESSGSVDWDRFEEISPSEIRDEDFESVHPVPHSFVLLRGDAVSRLEIDGSPWRGCRADSPDGKQEYMEDIDFVFRLITAGKFATVAGTGGIYNVRKGSLSDSNARRDLWCWRAYEMAIVPWADENCDSRLRRQVRRMRSIWARKYARSEKDYRIAMKVLSTDLYRRPRFKTIVAIGLFLLGLDRGRRASLQRARSDRAC